MEQALQDVRSCRQRTSSSAQGCKIARGKSLAKKYVKGVPNYTYAIPFLHPNSIEYRESIINRPFDGRPRFNKLVPA